MSFLNFLTNTAGGFLSGGPAGAALGALSGLAGDPSQRQTTSFALRPLTQGQKKIADQIERAAPGLIGRLSPAGQAKLLDDFQRIYREQAAQEITDTFDPARSRYLSSFARTGTGPSSVVNSGMANLAYQEGRARAGAMNQADLNAQGALTQATGRDSAILGQIMSILQGTYNGQAVGASQTTVSEAPGSSLQNALSGAGYALTSPYSYYNKSGMAKKVNGFFGVGGGASGAPLENGFQGPSYF